MVTSKRHWCQLAGSLVACYRVWYRQHFSLLSQKKRACDSIQLTFTEWQLHAPYSCRCWGREQNKKVPSIQFSILERRHLKSEGLHISLSLFTYHLCGLIQVNSYFFSSVLPVFKIGKMEIIPKRIVGRFIRNYVKVLHEMERRYFAESVLSHSNPRKILSVMYY